MDDVRTIEEIRSGNNELLTRVYQDYRKEFALWLIKHYGSDMDNAMEVYQETIIAFFENIKDGKLSELNSSIKTYLFSIGKNKYLSMARKAGRTVSGDAVLEVVGEDTDDIEEHKIKEERLSLVESSLLKLSAHCRQLLKLYYYEKLSMERIMERLDYKNANTAKNQKYKCMQQLRRFHSENAS